MHVNPPIDSQVLLFHGMSEKIVILHEEINLSQADTESAVDSARTHFAISINLYVPLKKKLLGRWARRVRVEFRNSLLFEIMAKLMKMWRARQTSSIASWGLHWDVSGAVHSRKWSWDLMEQAFDDGIIRVQMRKLLVLFPIGSGFSLIFAF